MTAFERNFGLHASSGVCDLCGERTLVLASVMDMKYKCMACCTRERLAYEERERQKRRVPLNLTEFTEL